MRTEFGMRKRRARCALPKLVECLTAPLRSAPPCVPEGRSALDASRPIMWNNHVETVTHLSRHLRRIGRSSTLPYLTSHWRTTKCGWLRLSDAICIVRYAQPTHGTTHFPWKGGVNLTSHGGSCRKLPCAGIAQPVIEKRGLLDLLGKRAPGPQNITRPS